MNSWTGSLNGKLKTIESKLDAQVSGTVRSIAGSLLVAGALFCFGLISSHAQTVDASTALTYVIDGNIVIITECDDSASGTLEIPSSYNGKPVTTIGGGAFSGCTSLTSVTIPDSVTRDLSGGQGIAVSAFNGCTSLTGIELGEGNTDYSSVDGVVFNKAKTTLITPRG